MLQKTDEGSAMKDNVGKLGTVVLGVMAGGVFLFGLFAIVFVLSSGQPANGNQSADTNLREPVAPAPLKHRKTHDKQPDIPAQYFDKEALTVPEKAVLANSMIAALGPLKGGWKLRPFKISDLTTLRTDLPPCKITSFSLEFCMMYQGLSSNGMWTYARGAERIVVWLTFERSKRARPLAERIKSAKRPDAFYTVFYPTSTAASWKDRQKHAGFEVRTAKQTSAEREAMPDLLRLRANIEDDAKMNIFLASNVDRQTTLGVLDAVDRRLVNAMIGPTKIAQGQAVAERETDFTIISETALRNKVAAMSKRSRTQYFAFVLKDAMAKDRAPDDYEITYFEMGSTGKSAAADFVTGILAKDHPGYKVLALEAQRGLPVGTCLQTPQQIYCAQEAEFLRIVNEIRRQNHEAKAQPSE